MEKKSIPEIISVVFKAVTSYKGMRGEAGLSRPLLPQRIRSYFSYLP